MELTLLLWDYPNTEIWRAWLSHQYHPYYALCYRIRSRTSLKTTMSESSESEFPSSVLTSDDLQYSLFPGLPDGATENGLELSPLDRWKNSPPETEAARLSDIVNSITISKSQDESPIRKSSQRSASSQRNQRSRRTVSSSASDSIRLSESSSLQRIKTTSKYQWYQPYGLGP